MTFQTPRRTRTSTIPAVLLIFLCCALVFSGCAPGDDQPIDAADWPGRKPIYVAVYASPGGATDLSNRAMAAAMEQELDATFSVLNMSGAQGGVAAAHVWNAERDGHTWFGTGESSLGMAVMGTHPTTSADWRYFLISGTPGALSVPEASPYQSMEALMEAIRANPGRVKIATSLPGSAWHVQYLALMQATGAEMNWVPYSGSHPSQVAALSGEVDVVLTGLGEQAEFLKAGQLRPLAVFQTDSYTLDGVGDIPAVTQAVPEVESYLPLRQFVGFALPADTPPAILDRIETAFRNALESPEIQRFSETAYSPILGLSGEEARAFTEQQQKIVAWFLYDAGIASKSPEDFGIPRPADRSE